MALVPNEIIFENIIPSSEGREKITLRNISGLPVKFKWITQEQKTELTLLKDVRIKNCIILQLTKLFIVNFGYRK